MTGPLIILMPCRDMIFYEAWMAIHQMANQCNTSYEGDVLMHTAKRPHVAHARNMMLGVALKNECEWLLWIDDDAVPPPDLLEKLMRRKKKWIAPAFVTRDHEPVSPAARIVGDHLEKVPLDGKLHAADATGFHAMLMHRDVVQSTVDHLKGDAPFFFGDPSPWDGTFLSEDFYFCVKAKEAGNKLWVDTSISVGHVTGRNLLP